MYNLEFSSRSTVRQVEPCTIKMSQDEPVVLMLYSLHWPFLFD